MKQRENGKVKKKVNSTKQKSNKLRFKSNSGSRKGTPPNLRNKTSTSTSSSVTLPNPHVSSSSPSSSSDEYDSIPSFKPFNSHPEPSTTTSSTALPEFIEWGPSINGYRFIGIPGEKFHYEKRNRLVNESETSNSGNYNWSYMKLPQYESRTKIDPLELKYGKIGGEGGQTDGESFNYDEYFKRWEYIKENGLRDVIFPVENQDHVELNKANVWNFLKTCNGDVKNGLKIERIRWHPDKMLRTLKIDVNDPLYGKLKGNITKTFQIINELWEESK